LLRRARVGARRAAVLRPACLHACVGVVPVRDRRTGDEKAILHLLERLLAEVADEPRLAEPIRLLAVAGRPAVLEGELVGARHQDARRAGDRALYVVPNVEAPDEQAGRELLLGDDLRSDLFVDHQLEVGLGSLTSEALDLPRRGRAAERS